MDLSIQSKIKIHEYFESVVNQLNKKGEEIVKKLSGRNVFRLSPGQVYSRRDRLIKQVESLMNSNLSCVGEKISTVKISDSMSENELNKVLFDKFCFLLETAERVEQADLKLDRLFGYLIIVDEYVEPEQLFYFRELFKYSSQQDSTFHNDFFFSLKPKNVKFNSNLTLRASLSFFFILRVRFLLKPSFNFSKTKKAMC